jgi:hypothetical protein
MESVNTCSMTTRVQALQRVKRKDPDDADLEGKSVGHSEDVQARKGQCNAKYTGS